MKSDHLQIADIDFNRPVYSLQKGKTKNLNKKRSFLLYSYIVPAKERSVKDTVYKKIRSQMQIK